MNRRHRLLLGLSVLALLAAACSGSSQVTEEFRTIAGEGDGGVAQAAETTVTAAPPVGVSTTVAGDTLGSGGVASVAIQPADLGRDIVFTADLTVAVEDVAAAGRQVTQVVERLGGFLFGQETSSGPDPVSVLTFKVPPENFTEALDQIGSVGVLRDQSVSASDVTGRIVDLQSQITTIEASIERLRSFLEQAPDTKTVVELEDALVERETELERLRGQLRTLERQVALATITVRLVQFQNRATVGLFVTAYEGGDDQGLSCPGSDSLSVERGQTVTVCFEVENLGDTNIAIVELRDPVLDVTLDELTVVFGDTDQILAPGESVMLATTVELDRTLRTRATVVAKAVDDEGRALTGSSPTANETSTIELRATTPPGVPSFFDGLRRSWQFLVRLFEFTLLLLGVAIPFAWVPVVVWLLVRWARSRPSLFPAPTPPPPAVPAETTEAEAGMPEGDAPSTEESES